MRYILTILVTLSSLYRLAAQPQPLTLDEAIIVSLADNPSLAANRHALAAARRMRQATDGLRAPAINIGGNYTLTAKDIAIDLDPLRNDITGAVSEILSNSVTQGIISPDAASSIQSLLAPIQRLDVDLTLQERDFALIGGEVTMPIWLGGKLNVATRSARINEQSVKQQGIQQRNAVISEVIERYFSLSLAMQSIEVLEQVVEGMRQHKSDAEAMVSDGVLAQNELLYIDYRCAEAERELRSAQLEAETLMQALSTSMGREQMRFIPITPMFVLDYYENIEHFKHLAAGNNPLIVQVELKERLANEGIKLERSDFMPQVVAMGGASFYDYRLTKILPRWAVGIGVKIKLFDGLNREYRLAAAKERLREVGSVRDEVQSDINLLVEKLYSEMTIQRYEIEALEKSILFARSYLESRQAAFDAGIATSTDLIDARLNLSKAHLERLQAACSFDIALARLLETVGISESFSDYIASNKARVITLSTNQK